VAGSGNDNINEPKNDIMDDLDRFRTPEDSNINNAGFLGKILGVGNAANRHIVLIILMLVIVFMFFIFFTNKIKDPKDYVVICSNIIILGLGYLFGKA
jgi:hypothetical protein